MELCQPNSVRNLIFPDGRQLYILFRNGFVNYRAGSLKAAAGELARYKLDVVGVQEVRWDKGSTARAGDYDFFYEKGNENHQLGTGFLYSVE
jgi:hypothetical protein